jgi:hypothetical protein
MRVARNSERVTQAVSRARIQVKTLDIGVEVNQPTGADINTLGRMPKGEENGDSRSHVQKQDREGRRTYEKGHY